MNAKGFVVIGMSLLVMAGCGRSDAGLAQRVAGLERKMAEREAIEALRGKSIHAESFRVVDKVGKTRAALSSTIDGNAALWLYDSNGTARMCLDIGDDVPRVQLCGRNGNTLAGLGVTEQGPEVVLYGENDKRGAVLTVSRLGPLLCLYDENGNLRASLCVDKDGPQLVLLDREGKQRAAVGRCVTQVLSTGEQTIRPESSLVLFDKDGKMLWQAP